MPYITREDGERFIIPSYRDILSAKKPALLKKEVLLLSTNYGEYITLQRKNVDQYEAAFSPDPGYLLGESVWHYFKRARDLIYCEAIPNTSEAILVIVKGGSVYLDGSFPVDSIPDELIVFRTQQNSFEIYIHGDVPISQAPEEGKFALDTSSVKSFNILPQPIFPTLPTNKHFQLRLVETVLKAQGIGVVPVKKIVGICVLLVVVWIGFSYFTSHKQELPIGHISEANPLQLYMNELASPSPAEEIQNIANGLRSFYAIPGWAPTTVEYNNGILQANVKSSGIKTSVLYKWADQNNAKVLILPDGIYIGIAINSSIREATSAISPLQKVIAEVIDRISMIIPGNNLTLANTSNKGNFSEAQLTINFNHLTIDTFSLLGEQFKGLPLVLTKVSLTIDNGALSGSVILNALGN
jgi:hypothetical protein